MYLCQYINFLITKLKKPIVTLKVTFISFLLNKNCVFVGKQFKIIVTFSGIRGIPIQTYGKLQLTLIDKNGLNETFPLTR